MVGNRKNYQGKTRLGGSYHVSKKEKINRPVEEDEDERKEDSGSPEDKETALVREG